MQEKINKIREIVITAVPSTMNLEFGCILHRWNDSKDYGYYRVLERGSGFHPDHVWVSSRVFGYMNLNKKEIFDYLIYFNH